MPKRTLKRGYTVSTYPCNGGYVTETISKYGERQMSKPYQKYGYWYVFHCEIQFVNEAEAWEYISDS